MEGLQRSAISFRRQGSSGLVWDDKLISEELNKDKSKNDDSKDGSDDQKGAELRRTKSDGGERRVYRTVKVEQVEDPPSPRVSRCGFGFGFGFCSGEPDVVAVNGGDEKKKKKSGKKKSVKKRKD